MTFIAPAARHDLIWAAVDFDGTLAETAWTPENPGSQVGEPIWANIWKLYDLIDAGYKIVIHTARGWHDYETIESWLEHHEIPVDAIVCGKLLAKVYIDDRALHESAASWVPDVR